MTVSPSDHAVAATSSSTVLSLNLPQPPKCDSNSIKYHYVCQDDLDETYNFTPRLTPDTLCWVLKSKGGQKRNGMGELFNRARVVSDDEENESKNRRILVRYPKGSTYHVRRCNLLPVLEKQQHIVLVAGETPEYRRHAIVHTLAHESFLEIGCDFGPTVHRVQTLALQINNDEGDNTNAVNDKDDKISTNRSKCLGIDKSTVSIEVARARYPHCLFVELDVLENPAAYHQLVQERVIGTPIVAIDINGNRELPAVLRCLECVIKTPEQQQLPRLIIVKSRLLHQQLKEAKS